MIVTAAVDVNQLKMLIARRLVRPQQKLGPHHHQGATLADPLLADQPPPAHPASPCH